MNARAIKIRLMKADDFDAVVGIDARVLKESRSEYYKLKFEKLFQSADGSQMSGSMKFAQYDATWNASRQF